MKEPGLTENAVDVLRKCIRSPKAVIKHSLGCPGWIVKETANVTQSLTCGLPDRESNETKYLREVTEADRNVAKEG